MLLACRYPFSVSKYYLERGHRPTEQTCGLVLRVSLAFDRWLDGRILEADAFIDPGADGSVISTRWLRSQWEQARPGMPMRWPVHGPEGYLNQSIESPTVVLKDIRLAMPSLEMRWQGSSEGGFSQMPGWEDLLLGRDFLSKHDILLVINGGNDFSLLWPHDSSNAEKKHTILTELAQG